MTTFKNSTLMSSVQQFFLTLVLLLLITQLHILSASTVGEVANLQEQQEPQQLQSKQNAEVTKKLSRYGSLYRSSGELSDDRTLFERLFGGKRATVHLNVNSDVANNAEKLISWIRRQSLQDSSLEDASENRGTVKAGLSKMAKRMMNCKPLKEQFKEFRGEVFKKGDNSFKNNLRDFLANCNNNDGIRF